MKKQLNRYQTRQVENKPGTAQVGFISKAQKYSRKNNWKNFEKIIFFSKKYLVKKVAYCQKSKRVPLGLVNDFFTNRKLQKIQGVPFDRIQKCSEKCRIGPKQNAKGGPFGLPSIFGSIKNFWFSARLEPMLCCFSDPRKSVLTARPRS